VRERRGVGGHPGNLPGPTGAYKQALDAERLLWNGPPLDAGPPRRAIAATGGLDGRRPADDPYI
jgi:hypothetical protein